MSVGKKISLSDEYNPAFVSGDTANAIEYYNLNGDVDKSVTQNVYRALEDHSIYRNVVLKGLGVSYVDGTLTLTIGSGDCLINGRLITITSDYNIDFPVPTADVVYYVFITLTPDVPLAGEVRNVLNDSVSIQYSTSLPSDIDNNLILCKVSISAASSSITSVDVLASKQEFFIDYLSPYGNNGDIIIRGGTYSAREPFITISGSDPDNKKIYFHKNIDASSVNLNINTINASTVIADSFSGDIVGNSTTADYFSSDKTVTFGGDVSGSITTDFSVSPINISLTVNNSAALGGFVASSYPRRDVAESISGGWTFDTNPISVQGGASFSGSVTFNSGLSVSGSDITVTTGDINVSGGGVSADSGSFDTLSIQTSASLTEITDNPTIPTTDKTIVLGPHNATADKILYANNYATYNDGAIYGYLYIPIDLPQSVELLLVRVYTNADDHIIQLLEIDIETGTLLNSTTIPLYTSGQYVLTGINKITDDKTKFVIQMKANDTDYFYGAKAVYRINKLNQTYT